MGIERLVGLFEACGGQAPERAPHVYMVAAGEGALDAAFDLAEQLRDGVAGIRVQVNLGAGSFKAQLKRADKSGAAYAVVLGDTEVASRRAGVKPLRSGDEQFEVGFDELVDELSKRPELPA